MTRTDKDTSDDCVTTLAERTEGGVVQVSAESGSIETFACTTNTRKHYGDEGSFPLIECRGNTREP